MKLTALEIKQQKFEKAFRGFDPAEVQAFLSLVSNEWEHLCSKNRELEQKIEELQKKIKHYERVEEALHETLETAKGAAESKLDSAQKEADHTIEKANMEADSIVKDAKTERDKVQQSISRLLDRRKEVVGRLRSYLNIALESVDQFAKDEAELVKKPNEDNNDTSEEPEAQKDTPQKSANKQTEDKASISQNIDDLVDGLD